MGFLIMRLIGFGASCEVVLLWGFDAHCGLIIPYKQLETKNMKHHNVIIKAVDWFAEFYIENYMG